MVSVRRIAPSAAQPGPNETVKFHDVLVVERIRCLVHLGFDVFSFFRFMVRFLVCSSLTQLTDHALSGQHEVLPDVAPLRCVHRRTQPCDPSPSTVVKRAVSNDAGWTHIHGSPPIVGTAIAALRSERRRSVVSVMRTRRRPPMGGRRRVLDDQVVFLVVYLVLHTLQPTP